MIRAYNKPFVKIDDMLSILQIPQITFYGWLNETEVPYTLIKNKHIYTYLKEIHSQPLLLACSISLSSPSTIIGVSTFCKRGRSLNESE